MKNQDTMTKLGTVLLGTCTNPEHVWTRIVGYGTKHVFNICMTCEKIKLKREG